MLAYLVRRLLENGANSSFVHQLTDDDVPVENIAADPFTDIGSETTIKQPGSLYKNRKNSTGFDLANSSQLLLIDEQRALWKTHQWQAHPLLLNKTSSAPPREVSNPAQTDDVIGTIEDASNEDIETAIGSAVKAVPEWRGRSPQERAEILLRAAELYESAFGEFSGLLAREAGKNMTDVIGEWREAIDFLRYYAVEVMQESSLQQRKPLGVFATIAPWNFPLSIFTGQIAAALATGNVVLAKPAEQSSLIAFCATQLLHEAGVPLDVLQLVLGDGERAGATLTRDSRINGICFTGSTEVAQVINRASVDADPRLRFIAETGGINAMIVDSTALPEQSVRDIITSAFYSAGQRCSALRIVYLQDDVADRLIEMLIGAMKSLTIGDPWNWETDVGPAIDKQAQQTILDYIDSKRVLFSLATSEQGHFVPPTVVEVNGIADIETEVFGPVLHIARFKATQLENVISSINSAEYGLTFSIHTRLTQKVDRVIEKLNIGNVYANRNQIGAVVESQPFGGQGLSGTGPKAGGPLYLPAFTRGEAETKEPAPNKKLRQLVAAQINEVTDKLGKRHKGDNLAKLNKLFPDNATLSVCNFEINRRMPGPTGERNIYQLRTVGLCLCLGPTAEIALVQALQVLAFGGAAILICESTDDLEKAVKSMQKEKLAVDLLEGVPRSDALKACTGIDALSFCVTDNNEEEGRRIRRALTERDGKIIRYITELISPMDYLHEIHVCNDITSSGGNVELMSIS